MSIPINSPKMKIYTSSPLLRDLLFHKRVIINKRSPIQELWPASMMRFLMTSLFQLKLSERELELILMENTFTRSLLRTLLKSTSKNTDRKLLSISTKSWLTEDFLYPSDNNQTISSSLEDLRKSRKPLITKRRKPRKLRIKKRRKNLWFEDNYINIIIFLNYARS